MTVTNLDYALVDKSECVLHKNKPNKFGHVYLTRRKQGKRTGILAHRLAWEEAYGAIPEGLCCLHKCDIPACINPEHLFLGTTGDNTRDMVNKGRASKGAAHYNSKLNEYNVKMIRLIYKTVKVTQAKLAAQFGVTNQQISEIINRKQWQHI